MLPDNLPNHIGIILDGNRRWAKDNKKSPMQGHWAGYKILRDLAVYVLKEKKIKHFSAFVFSTENWKRSEKEVSFILKLVHRALTEYLDDFHKNNIRILIIGSRQNLSKDIINAIDAAESKTAMNDGGNLALCFNYGGQQEVVDALNNILNQKDRPETLSIDDVHNAMYHPEVPPLDMIVRTSNEQRLSGFMLWRAAYAELLFVPKYWPDFTTDDIDQALDDYTHRQRRYGK